MIELFYHICIVFSIIWPVLLFSTVTILIFGIIIERKQIIKDIKLFWRKKRR